MRPNFKPQIHKWRPLTTKVRNRRKTKNKRLLTSLRKCQAAKVDSKSNLGIGQAPFKEHSFWSNFISNPPTPTDGANFIFST